MTRPREFSFTEHRVRWQGLVEAALGVGLAGSWLGLGGRWVWLLDLFSHFRWQALAVALIAVFWAWWQRRRLLLWSAVLTLILNGWLLLANRPIAPTGKRDPAFQVRVVSLNVLTSNQDHAALLNFLQLTDADLIFLMEVDQTWVKALKPLLLTHPHHLLHPQDDNFGLAFYSRLPVEDLHILTNDKLGADPGNALITHSVEVRLTTAGHQWGFIGAHPVPPMGGRWAAARDRQLQALGQRIARSPYPVLIAGDFNATPWSEGYRQLTANTPLLPAPSNWKPTWKARSLLAIPIDQALSSPPLGISSRLIGPDVGSDHRAQVLKLQFAGNE